MAKAIMIQGTMSNAGKSLIAAGLCRIFKQDGYRVAPFKAQNMALNSYITKENLEMGRAQVVQAEAAGVEPEVAMNPILLKPTTDMGSQVIVGGEVVGNMRAMDYFKKKRDYIPVIQAAYDKLSREYDIIVIEGAGSPAEINLKQDDIVNMGMAKMADAPVLLVGDIDRGGVFAQLIGTVMLLEPEEQDRIAGLIINKFRGDVEILKPGLSMLTERCGKEVLGVVPYADVDIEEEDSLAESLSRKNYRQGVDVAVIRLPKVSNFTDFQALALEPALSVRYVEKCSELGKPDVIILPGTKNTIQDMLWLRESGLEAAILRLVGSTAEDSHFEDSPESTKETMKRLKNASKQGEEKSVPLLIGICGGYQMLGKTITDSCGVESGSGDEEPGKRTIKGMGLLPMDTYFEQEKTRTRVEGYTLQLAGSLAGLSGKKISGYEIHMGRSEHAAQSLLEISGRLSQNSLNKIQFPISDEILPPDGDNVGTLATENSEISAKVGTEDCVSEACGQSAGESVRNDADSTFHPCAQETTAHFESFSKDENIKYDGCYTDSVMGTYIHGIFDEEDFRKAFVKLLCARKGLKYTEEQTMSFREYKEMQYDKLADIIRNSLDMERIYEIMNLT